MNPIEEETSQDGMSCSTAGTPLSTPTRPYRLLGDPENSDHSSDGPPQLSPFQDEPIEKRNKKKSQHPKPEAAPALQMPPIDSDDDASEDLDAALEKWADELEKSNRSPEGSTEGTEPHDNRSGSDNAMMEQWGHESLPALLDTGEMPVHSNLHTTIRRPSHYFAPLDDPFKAGIDDDDDDDYVCFGCIKREWSSSNPCMAFVIIIIQVLIVVIFVMLFYPNHNDHSVTNSTAVPISSSEETNGNFTTPLPTLLPTPAPSLPEDTVPPVTTPKPTQKPYTPAPSTAQPTETTNKPLSGQATPKPTQKPYTPAPSTSSTDTLVGTTMFLNWLPDATQEAIKTNGRSPQARAFDWMLQDPNWSEYDQDRVLQRFALACLYFATQGDGWSQSTGWLDYNRHECDWGHVPTNGRLYDANSPICSSSERSYQSIQLANNNLQGTIPLELQLLTNLQILDLSQNTNLTGDLPESIFANCLDLKLLLVFENRLMGTISPSIAGLAHLEGVHAWDNGFTGPIFPNNVLLMATNLRHWHVGNNRLTGTFPNTQQQASPSQVESLWVYGNEMTGSLSEAVGDWSQLTSLLAWENQLTGTLPTLIGSLKKLEQLDLEQNRMGGSIPSELGVLSARMKGLWLSSNNFTSSIPGELELLQGLTILSLHSNSLTGTIFEGIGQLTNLIDASFQDNLLRGTVPTQVGNMRSLRTLEAGGNQLDGPIPSQVGRLSNLERLHLSHNRLTGPIPPEIGRAAELGQLLRLEALFLDQNLFTGAIPTELGLLSYRLTILDLSGNQLTSTIPTELGQLMVSEESIGGKLEQLRLFQNQLSGSLAGEFFPREDNEGSPLVQFAVEQNSLTGTIPTLIGRCTSLQDISLGDNQFQGILPSEIGLLRPVSLDVKGNQLAGSIPSEIGSMSNSLVKLDLGGNVLTSSIPTQIGDLFLLSTLGLSSNKLWWTIPSEIGRLSHSLQKLHLASNTFAGWIPTEVGELTELEEFHLDDNLYIFGELPTESLAELSNLRELKLNGTALTGVLPEEVCDIDVLQVDCAVGGNLRTGVCGCYCDC